METNLYVEGRLIGALPGTAIYRTDTDERLSLSPEGRFRAAVEQRPDGDRQAVPLRIELSPGISTYFSLEDSGEVVLLSPQVSTDPVEAVSAERQRLARHLEAQKLGREVIADRSAARAEEADRVQRVVGHVLSSLAGTNAGDTTWRLDSGRTLSTMTNQAVASAAARVNEREPMIAVRSGDVVDGERLASGTLVRRVLGAEMPPELRRRSALETLARRDDAVGADGLPRPLSMPAGSEPEGGVADVEDADQPAGGEVSAKIVGLVDAMRLPEDPPLLVAGSAISSPGGEVELQGGAADAIAFHDFHELALAMPTLWSQVFDSEFVAIVEQSVQELIDTGADVDALLDENEVRPEKRLLRMLEASAASTAADRATETRLFRPQRLGRSPGGRDLQRGMVASSDPVMSDSGSSTQASVHIQGAGVDKPEAGEQKAVDSSRQLSLLEELRLAMRGSHSFTVFPAQGRERAINFGMLLTWRQRWEPLSYQTGKIVHTTTLAPGEIRKVTTKLTRRRKRVVAEVEKSSQMHSSSSTDTGRAESEIIRAAVAKTKFMLHTEGSSTLLVQDGSFKTTTTRDIGNDSNDTRRRFRESVLTAAQEYSEEFSITVNAESEDAFEEETTSELINPSKELAMTYLLYSLQRRYNVSEHLHRALPVVMVAMPVPTPSQITSAWLTRHAWILEGVLLADRFRPALRYITSTFVGDSEVLGSLSSAVVAHKAALDAAQHRLTKARSLTETRSSSLNTLRNALAAGDADGFWDLPGFSLVRDAHDLIGGLLGGSDDDQEKREREALLVAAAEDELERADREARDADGQLASATNAYQQAVTEYVEARRVQRTHEVRIAELRIHVADNILYYMHAIWAAQPPDQRFFELHNVLAPKLDMDVLVSDSGTFDAPGVGGFTPQQFQLGFVDDGAPPTMQPLAEVADLDGLLGFKGNYAIFPMRQGNALTDVLMLPYLDNHEVLRDPQDVAANWTMEELRAYADRLRERVRVGELDQTAFDDDHAPFLRATLERLLSDPQPSSSVVVVPSDSLYAELLTSGTSLIDPYMRESRSLDVAKSRAEIRGAELENLRRAARLEDAQLADPTMDEFERHLVRIDSSDPTP